MKKIVKFLVVIVFFAIIAISENKICDADWTPTTWDRASTTTTIESGKATKANDLTQRTLGTLINVIRIVGTGVAIIMLTYVAIKYMSAAPSEKAEFKKSATAYVVGAVVLFAATNILSVISNFATTNLGS